MNEMVAFKQSKWIGAAPALFLNALKGSQLSFDDLVIRETLQNSYDARSDKNIPVDFRISLKMLSYKNLDFLEKYLPTFDSPAAESLVRELKKTGNDYCLQIRDSNTVGLNGPYQVKDSVTGEPLDDLKEHNYRDFVWTMGGEKSAKKGGAFGVGKTALFLVSNVRTVCIYSRTKYQGKLESRFIIKSFYPYELNAATNYEQFWFSKKRDDSFNENFPLPFLDDEADELAKGIGMDLFDKDETGTCSLILALSFDTEEGKKIDQRYFFRNEFHKKMRRWFWTKLIAADDIPIDKQIKISLYDGDSKISLGDTSEPNSLYFPFSRCLGIWRDNYGKQVSPHYIAIELKKPKVSLGAVTYVKVDSREEYNSEFFPNGENLCLVNMRDVEFCINYTSYHYPKIEKGKVVFALFHTDPYSFDISNNERRGAVDAAFSRSENRTHNEWVEASVTGRDRTYVRQGKEKTKEALGLLFDEKENLTTSITVSSSLSTSLGRFLPYGVGFGAALNLGGKGEKKEKQSTKHQSNILNFSIFDAPVYEGNGWRKITCLLKITERITARVNVYPVVQTIDGSVIKKTVADNRVKILDVRCGISKEDARASTRVSFRTLDKTPFLNKEGYYLFDVNVFGDIDFDLRVKEV